MKCHLCDNDAIINQPPRCKEHFIKEFESRVRDTIERFGMINPEDNILVAASGGKDSLTLLTLLNKWYKKVTAVVINEGIAGYREFSLADLKKVCNEHDIPLIIKSYEEFAGDTLDNILKKKDFRPCDVCGAFRRHLLNEASKDFDVIATGHNMDDEAQAFLMNLLKGHTDVIPRSGPVSGYGAKGFTKRVKPLYFCTEKEVMTYAFLHNLVGKFTECPNVRGSYRDTVRDALNNYEQSHPGFRRALLDAFLRTKDKFPPAVETELEPCKGCGEPCASGFCKSCQFLEKLKV